MTSRMMCCLARVTFLLSLCQRHDWVRAKVRCGVLQECGPRQTSRFFTHDVIETPQASPTTTDSDSSQVCATWNFSYSRWQFRRLLCPRAVRDWIALHADAECLPRLAVTILHAPTMCHACGTAATWRARGCCTLVHWQCSPFGLCNFINSQQVVLAGSVSVQQAHKQDRCQMGGLAAQFPVQLELAQLSNCNPQKHEPPNNHDVPQWPRSASHGRRIADQDPFIQIFSQNGRGNNMPQNSPAASTDNSRATICLTAATFTSYITTLSATASNYPHS